MSAKPTVFPEWATVPVAGGVVVPSVAKQQRGWVPGERPPAQYFNWLLVNIYLWLKYLGDGDLVTNSITVATTLGVTGAVTLSSTLGVTGQLSANGGITIPTAKSLLLNGTTTLTVGTGATVLGGTLAVTGLMTANAGMSVPTGQNITLVGTAEMKHGDRTRNFNPAAVAQGSGNWTVGVGASNELFAISSASSFLYFPLDISAGDRIKTISFKVFGNGVTDLTTNVFYVTAAMVGTSIGGPISTNDQPASWSTVTIDVTDTAISATDSVYISFNVSASGLRIGNISYTYDRP